MTGNRQGGQWSRRLAPPLVGTGVPTLIYGVGRGALIIAFAGLLILVAGIAPVAQIAQLRRNTDSQE